MSSLLTSLWSDAFVVNLSMFEFMLRKLEDPHLKSFCRVLELSDSDNDKDDGEMSVDFYNKPEFRGLTFYSSVGTEDEYRGNSNHPKTVVSSKSLSQDFSPVNTRHAKKE